MLLSKSETISYDTKKKPSENHILSKQKKKNSNWDSISYHT